MNNFRRFTRRVIRDLKACGVDGCWMKDGKNPTRYLCDDAALVIERLHSMLMKERNRRRP